MRHFFSSLAPSPLSFPFGPRSRRCRPPSPLLFHPRAELGSPLHARIATATAHGLHAEAPPPPSLDPSHPWERIPLGSLVLYDPSTTAPSHRSAAAHLHERRRAPTRRGAARPLSHGPNRVPQYLPSLSVKLLSPAKPPSPHRCGAAATQGRRRRPRTGRHRPPQPQLRPPAGAHEPPHPFPQLPPRRRGRTSLETAPSDPPLFSVRPGTSG